MPDSSSSELLTRLLTHVIGPLGIGGVLLGVAKYRLERAEQFVRLGLMQAQAGLATAQAKEHEANAHKITVDGLVATAKELREERDYWKDRAEKCERKPLEKRLSRDRKGRG